MKTLGYTLLFIAVLPLLSYGQARKKGKNAADEWRYEMECVGVSGSGSSQSVLVKVWSYSRKPKIASEFAKRNAVHGVVFKGITSNDKCSNIPAMLSDPAAFEQHSAFFDEFFADGGRYMKFVTLTNQGLPEPGDIKKTITKEFKIGIVVKIDVDALRKDLMDSGIIGGFWD